MATLAFNRAEIAARELRPELLEMDGISRASVEAHYKLYQGYVAKRNEILTKLARSRHRPGEPGLLRDPRAEGRPDVRDRRGQEPRDLLRAPGRRRRQPGRGDRRADRARLRQRGRLARRPGGDGHGRPRLGLDGLRLRRAAPLQLHRRRAEHLPDLERGAARGARRLRARLLPRLPDRPGVLHRGLLRQPRLDRRQRLGRGVRHQGPGRQFCPAIAAQPPPLTSSHRRGLRPRQHAVGVLAPTAASRRRYPHAGEREPRRDERRADSRLSLRARGRAPRRRQGRGGRAPRALAGRRPRRRARRGRRR